MGASHKAAKGAFTQDLVGERATLRTKRGLGGPILTNRTYKGNLHPVTGGAKSNHGKKKSLALIRGVVGLDLLDKRTQGHRGPSQRRGGDMETERDTKKGQTPALLSGKSKKENQQPGRI